VIFLGTLLLLAGLSCTIRQEYAGSPLPVDDLPLLKAGMTKAEVLGLLGPPDDMGLRLQGSVFIYRYAKGEAAGLSVSAYQASLKYDRSDSRMDRVVVFFDKRGVVTEIGILAGTRGR
jgi:hypothetical protein